MAQWKNKEEYEKWKAEKTRKAYVDGLNKKQDPAPVAPDVSTTIEGEPATAIAAKKCPYCYSSMDLRATVCPSCKKKVMGADKNGVARRPTSAVGVSLFFIFVLFLFSAVGLCSNRGGSGPSTYIPSDNDAIFMSRVFIEKRLKAPSTADFASYSNSSVTRTSTGTFLVSSYVDAQNSFGAKIRTHYTCELQYVGNENWKALSCSTSP